MSTLGLLDLLPGALLSPRQVVFALHSFAFYFFSRFFSASFSLCFVPFAFQHTLFLSVVSSVILLSPIRKPLAPSGLCFVSDTLGLQLPRLCGSSCSIHCLPACSLFVGHYYDNRTKKVLPYIYIYIYTSKYILVLYLSLPLFPLQKRS